MNVKYIVELPAEEREELEALVASGKAAARKIRRANILLMADGQAHLDKDIATALSVGTSTVYRTKRRWVEEGLVAAICERQRRGSGLRHPSAADPTRGNHRSDCATSRGHRCPGHRCRADDC